MVFLILIFFNSAIKFLKPSHIDEVIYAELPIVESNLTCELIRIVTSLILYNSYGKINLN